MFKQDRKEILYPWYTGKTLIETLDSFENPYSLEMNELPLRFNVHSTSADNPGYLVGKVEQGVLRVNDNIYLYPMN